MGFTVEQLLGTELMTEVKLLTGQEGISREIRGVTIIEAPDIVKFIRGGELLLTGLYAFKSCTVEEFQEYIREFGEKEISGIVLKKGREVSQADEKIALLENYAARWGIPLMEMPFAMSFRQILSLVMEHLFGEEVTQLKYFKATHDNFTALSLSSAYRERPVEAVLDMLGKLIRNPVALYSQNMTCYAATEDDAQDFVLSRDARAYDPGFITNCSYLCQEEQQNRYIVRIRVNAGVRMYLVVTERDSAFSPMDCVAVENAIVALQYEFSRMFAISELEKKFQNDILYNILQGRVGSPAELRKSAGLLGLKLEGHYRALVFAVEGAENPDGGMDEKIRDVASVEEGLRRQYPELKLHRDMDRLTALQAAGEERSQAQCRKELEEMVGKLQDYALAAGRKVRLRGGAGKQVCGLRQVPESYREALEALNFVEVLQGVRRGGEVRTALFSDLGIFQLLSRVDDPEKLKEYIPESLQRLYDCDRPQKEDLVETLETYLEFNQNLSRTAQSLYIHYKTAAYRIERIARITGMDFSDPMEMLAVRIGLVVHRMAERGKRRD